MTSIDSTPGPALADLFGVDDEGPDLLAAGLDRNVTFEMHGSSRASVSRASVTARVAVR